MLARLAARRRHAFTWLLAFALLAAQGLALVHGIVHAGHERAEEATSAHDSVAHLFGHDDDAECRLYDAVHGGAALVGSAAIVALPVATQRLQHADGESRARWATLYDARGPPALS